VYEVRAFWEDAAVDQGSCDEGDFRYRTTRALETYVMKQADAITCICDGLRSDIVSRGISPDKVTVIPNAVDLEEFAPGALPDAGLLEKLGLTGMKVLGFVGSFYAFEGLDLLVKTLPAIVAVQDDIRVLLVGGGQEETRLRHQTQALGVADKVVFVGRVPHDQVHRYYDLIDILVYPRAKIRLTELVTPLKPLEAMARRRLVLASDVGGHRELIREGSNGFLFRAGDQKDLADRVLSLFQDRSQWHRVRSEARRFVEEERNWGKVVSGYVSVYHGVLPKGSSAGRTREFSHHAGA
jgi:PEP-CTERM/exosortase A-associated glycosyltransferase